MKRVLLAVICTIAFAPPSLAQAPQCTVPNTLTNGQVADATEVMDNFNAVAACVDQSTDNAVTHEGTPNAGEIAVFDSATGITGGDLTGDVTTSGSTATTLTATGVAPGTYTNTSITVDEKGRVTFAESGSPPTSGSGGSLATKYTVATPGDSFIDVPLDADGGFAYRVMVKGEPDANAAIGFRVSSDNGATFFSGGSDYKSYDEGALSHINLSSRNTIKNGRNTIATFTLAGMNVLTNDRIAVVGEVFTINTSIRNVQRHIVGHNNALPPGNFNAFRVYVNAGTMNNLAVYVQRIY